MTHTNLSHEDFVRGLTNGSLKVKFVQLGAFWELFRDPFVVKIMRILFLLVFAPIILIPAICLHFGKWVLLTGFAGSILGQMIHGINSVTSKPLRNFIKFTFCLAFLAGELIYYLGVLHVISFIVLCLLYQFFFADLSNTLHDEIAKSKLIKDPDRYYVATENGIVRVVER